jgi:hypothetical protein
MVMRPGSALLVLLATVGLVASMAHGSDNDSDSEQWRLTSESGAIKLYSRVRPGSALKEFRAMGTVDAPTRVVNKVINDVEGYPSFMPFTAECRILQRQGNSIYTYQRISPKIIGDRDYALQVEETSWPAKPGFTYVKHWKPANEAGPPEKKDVLRVKLCEGGWLPRT